MLLENFYKVVSLDQADNQKHTAVIEVNPAHDVFKGHFPGNPVMPGVCMMQIIKELTEKITSRKLVMQSLSNVKFMALINPDVTPELRIELDIVADDELVKVKNTTMFNDTTALKLSSVYKRQN
ncbi:MAG TPA: 3-hydroxyacyl-ACP dehydratase [Flavobacterium sp.]|jgi:3-hydroxyacyl-[acyl-carrier-protein] dehydratase